MGAQGIFCGQLARNLEGCLFLNAPDNKGLRQFIQFVFRLVFEFLSFPGNIRLFSVRLRTDRDVLPGGHGHGAGNESRGSCHKDLSGSRGSCGNTDDQAGG